MCRLLIRLPLQPHSVGKWPGSVTAGPGCAGHFRSARGFRAFDADDKEIGLYPTPDAGVAALLELATAGDA